MCDDCVFCKIASGEIPANIIFEDNKAIAFDDLNPMMPVHTLIIPKEHYAHMGDNVPDEIMGHLFNTVKKVAHIKGVDKNGYRIQVNTGDDAQQSVHHLHIHLLGGEKMNDGSPKSK